MEEKIIHIDWKRLKSIIQIEQLNGEEDYGVYQIYGDHPVYGINSLLYIGQTQDQTFAKRIKEHEYWINDSDHGNITIYTGTLSIYNEKTKNYISLKRDSRYIEFGEKLLIYVHQPAYNTKEKEKITDISIKSIHILNWFEKGDLLPEVSGARWSDFFPEE